MGKLLLFLSFIATALLLVFGLADPENPVMWLASTSTEFAVLRIIILASLMALLVTNPPRNAYLRGVVGVVVITIAAWSISATYQNQMKFLDSMSLLQFSIAAGVAVLERGQRLVTAVQPIKKPAQKSAQTRKLATA